VIQVTRLNGTHFYINAELIQTVESTPDTIITLINGNIMVVHEPAEEIIARILDYRKKLYSDMPVHQQDEIGNGE
jgi:flagellar protein FlbD